MRQANLWSALRRITAGSRHRPQTLESFHSLCGSSLVFLVNGCRDLIPSGNLRVFEKINCRYPVFSSGILIADLSDVLVRRETTGSLICYIQAEVDEIA